MASERTGQILDAVARCIARRGIDGFTLEQVAAESGLSRSLIRHYAGNRDNLIAMFRQRLLTYYTYAFEPHPDADITATELVLRTLFDEVPDLDEYAAIDAIFAASRFDESLRADLRDYYLGLEDAVAGALTRDHPDWAEHRVRSAAYQTLILAYGHWTMTALGFPGDRDETARTMARTLLGLDPEQPAGTSRR